MWCGVARANGSACSAEETVAVAGDKEDIAGCPYKYDDNGFKADESGKKFRRVCEYAV
jgi:hypothetical protein